MHSQHHVDSEYVLNVGVNRKGAELIGNKHTHSLISYNTQALLVQKTVPIKNRTFKLYVKRGRANDSNRRSLTSSLTNFE